MKHCVHPIFELVETVVYAMEHCVHPILLYQKCKPREAPCFLSSAIRVMSGDFDVDITYTSSVHLIPPEEFYRRAPFAGHPHI